MRVATFNILHGRTVGSGVDIELLRESIRRLNPDVLALQEVDREQERSGRADLTAVAADAMNAIDHRFVAAIAGTPGATWIAATGDETPDTAGYGIALLSRFPVSAWQVLRLPRIPVRFPIYLREPRKMVIVNEEPRAVVLARIETPLGAMTVANSHLSFVPAWNRWQLRRLLADLRGLPGPRLLLGDLNLDPAAVQRRSGMRALARAATFPAPQPRRQLDHIITDDPELVVETIEAPELPISDHRALVVELRRR